MLFAMAHPVTRRTLLRALVGTAAGVGLAGATWSATRGRRTPSSDSRRTVDPFRDDRVRPPRPRAR